MIPGVDTRGRNLAAKNASGGGGRGGGEEPGLVFYIVVLSVMGAIGGLVFGIVAAVEAFSLSSANAWIGFVVSGVCCGVLGIACAIIYQDSIFAWFDDPPPTGSSEAQGKAILASAPGELPLLAVVSPQGCV